MAYLAGYQANIYVASGAAVTFTNDPMTGDAARVVYTIDAATKRFWDRSTAVVVEKDIGAGYVLVDAADYTVNYAGGQIVFKVALPPGTLGVRVDGAYFAYSQLAQASEWSLDVSRELKESNVFGASWDTYEAVNGTGRLTAVRFWYDSFFYDQILTLLGFKLMPNSSGTAAWYAFGRVASQSPKVTAKELQVESLAFEVYGNIAYIP
jgi:hypothetical protein